MLTEAVLVTPAQAGALGNYPPAKPEALDCEPLKAGQFFGHLFLPWIKGDPGPTSAMRSWPVEAM